MRDLGRGLRIELNNMAKRLGMKFIGFNPSERKVSLEFQGKGLTYSIEEFFAHYQSRGTPQSGSIG